MSFRVYTEANDAELARTRGECDKTELLIINGHDYSKYILAKGYGWSRNDVDSDMSTRTRDGRMRRDKLGTKRKLTYTARGMSRETLAQLDDDLSQTSFRARYTDLHGVMEREFYCAELSVALCSAAHGQDGCWEAADFSLIEI